MAATATSALRALRLSDRHQYVRLLQRAGAGAGHVEFAEHDPSRRIPADQQRPTRRALRQAAAGREFGDAIFRARHRRRPYYLVPGAVTKFTVYSSQLTVPRLRDISRTCGHCRETIV